jgi:hypothetical protein
MQQRDDFTATQTSWNGKQYREGLSPRRGCRPGITYREGCSTLGGTCEVGCSWGTWLAWSPTHIHLPLGFPGSNPARGKYKAYHCGYWWLWPPTASSLFLFHVVNIPLRGSLLWCRDYISASALIFRLPINFWACGWRMALSNPALCYNTSVEADFVATLRYIFSICFHFQFFYRLRGSWQIGFLSPVQNTWKDWRPDRIRTGKDRDWRSRSWFFFQIPSPGLCIMTNSKDR